MANDPKQPGTEEARRLLEGMVGRRVSSVETKPIEGEPDVIAVVTLDDRSVLFVKNARSRRK